MADIREKWGSKIGFILAAAGSAIGLGNIWKFPYIAGENGGAAFIIIYVVCIAVIGLPVIIAEILMGRTTQRNPVGAFKALTKSKFWPIVGAMGVIAGFVILSFYGVVAGWSVGYIYEAAAGNFSGFNTPAISGNHFVSLTSNPVWSVGMLIIFMVISMIFVYAGVQRGIERGAKILMPLLFILLVVVMIRGITMEGSSAGLSFLFNPDFSKVTGETILVALGHAFFTLSLGMGAMMTYGSYMSEKDSIPGSGLQVVILDTFIALIAGVAIFTAVFATGQNTAEGPGLIFQTLPIVFAKMPGGYIIAILFFILLTIAALTSAISLLEVVTAYFIDEKKWKRHNAVITFGTCALIVGIPSALSFNVMSDTTFLGLTFFDLADYLASNIMLPLGGLLIAVFVAYVWGLDKAIVELKKGAEHLFEESKWRMDVWKILVKYFAPILIFLVLLNSLGILQKIIGLFS